MSFGRVEYMAMWLPCWCMLQYLENWIETRLLELSRSVFHLLLRRERIPPNFYGNLYSIQPLWSDQNLHNSPQKLRHAYFETILKISYSYYLFKPISLWYHFQKSDLMKLKFSWKPINVESKLIEHENRCFQWGLRACST